MLPHVVSGWLWSLDLLLIHMRLRPQPPSAPHDTAVLTYQYEGHGRRHIASYAITYLCHTYKYLPHKAFRPSGAALSTFALSGAKHDSADLASLGIPRDPTRRCRARTSCTTPGTSLLLSADAHCHEVYALLSWSCINLTTVR